jgi:hypothetical protein
VNGDDPEGMFLELLGFGSKVLYLSSWIMLSEGGTRTLPVRYLESDVAIVWGNVVRVWEIVM